jgi:hypothetical protein
MTLSTTQRVVVFVSLLLFFQVSYTLVTYKKQDSSSKMKTVWNKNENAADPLLSQPSMLEISTRPWLYLLSQKYQKNITQLKDIPIQEFEKIKNEGYQIVWMMGVWHLGTVIRLT